MFQSVINNVCIMWRWNTKRFRNNEVAISSKCQNWKLFPTSSHTVIILLIIIYYIINYTLLIIWLQRKPVDNDSQFWQFIEFPTSLCLNCFAIDYTERILRFSFSYKFSSVALCAFINTKEVVSEVYLVKQHVIRWKDNFFNRPLQLLDPKKI